MKQTVYLHIGLPKTGTTYLQQQFFIKRQWLMEQGVYVPLSGAIETNEVMGIGHHLLPINVQPERWDQFEYFEPLKHARVWDQLREEITSSKQRNALISSELFALDLFGQDKIKDVRKELEEFDVKIVLVLRDVVDFSNSLYSQFIRDGMSFNVSRFLHVFCNHLNYKNIYDEWAKEFEITNVIVLDYDAITKGDIFAVFIKILFSISAEPVKSGLTGKPANVSLSKRATLLIQEINSNDLPTETKSSLIEHIKNFYQEQNVRSIEKGFLSDEQILTLKKNCNWPETVSPASGH